MNPTDLVRSAIGNAFRRPFRAVLTIVAVAIGAFTFTITSGLGTGINAYIDSQTRAIGATNTVQVTATSPTSFLNESMEEYDEDMTSAGTDIGQGIMSEDDIRRIASHLRSDDELVSTEQIAPLYYSYDGGQRFRFIYNGYWPGKEMNLVAGEQLSDDTGQAQIIIPSYATQPLGFATADDAIGETVQVGVLGKDGLVRDVNAIIVGSQERSLIGGNLPFGNDTFNEQLQTLSWEGAPPGEARWYTTALVSGDNLGPVMESLRKDGFAVSTAEQIVGDYQSIVSVVLLMLNLLASVAIAAAMFGIINTLLMSVQERTPQIGMLRALGMSRGTVFLTVALEAGILSLIGAITAVALAVTGGLLLGPTALEAAGLNLPGLQLFEFEPGSILFTVTAVTLAALLAAVLPARRAARLDPMDALRGQQ